MKTLRLAYLGSITLLLGIGGMACAASSTPDDEDNARQSDELVGAVKTDLRPEIGRLTVEGRTCTATLVASSVVITAARCVRNRTGRIDDPDATFTIDVPSSVSSTHNAGGQRRYAAVEATSFDDGPSADDNIALVRLGDRVQNSIAKPIRLASSGADTGELVALYGYGCKDRETEQGGGYRRRLESVAGTTTQVGCGEDLGGPVLRGSATQNTGMIDRINTGIRGSGEDRFADVAPLYAKLVNTIQGWGDDERAAPACAEFTGTEMWTCQAGTTDRVRCANGGLERVACASACLSRPIGTNDVCASVDAQPGSLQSVVDQIANIANARAPGTTFGFAVRNLQTNETASFNGDTKIVSASAAKAIWMAVGVKDVGIEACEPHAYDTFALSGDFEVAKVIDKLSSLERVNTFMWNEAGMPNSGFCTWHRENGTLQISSNCPRAMGSDNYFTANDTMEFMTRLWRGSLLDSTKRAWLMGWLTHTHREGFGAWIINQLPEWTQPSVMHKPGWLSPRNYPGYAISNDIGIVQTGNGEAYAISTLSSGPGDAWLQENRQTQMLEYASCVVFHAITHDVSDPFASCWHP